MGCHCLLPETMLDYFLFSWHVKEIIHLFCLPKDTFFYSFLFSVFSTSSPRILILVCLAASPILCPSSTSCDTLAGWLLEDSHLLSCVHTATTLTACSQLFPLSAWKQGSGSTEVSRSPSKGLRKLALSLALGVAIDWLKPDLVVSLFCQRQVQS